MWNLNYVREFLVLADVLQFQEAADILFISQSSLSKHIKAIKAELGRDLFVRSKRAVALTDFGKACCHTPHKSEMRSGTTQEIFLTVIRIQK